MNGLFEGSVRHIIDKQHARPIRQPERKVLYEKFQAGETPMHIYKQNVSSKEGDVIIAGNYNHCGKGSAVLKQISTESKKEDRCSSKPFESLQDIKSISKGGTGKVKGFIQSIGIDPPYVHYYSETRIRIWHDLACRDVVFLDATGSLVRSVNDSKKVLYYEISFRNPAPGLTSIPVGSRLSADQSAPSVSNFLEIFRQGEKLIFGHNNTTQPLQINIDFSMVLLIPLLKCFNMGTLNEYLTKVMTILNGEANPNALLHSTVIHICLYHIMKAVKGHMKRFPKEVIQICMFFFSLLAKSENIEEAKRIILDGAVLFNSAYITPSIKKNTHRIINKINTCDPSEFNIVESEGNTELPDLYVPNKGQQPSNQSKEDFNTQSKNSIFKMWVGHILKRHIVSEAAEKDKSNATKDNKNKYFCPQFVDILFKLYLPTIPLWSCVLLGDLRRLCMTKYAHLKTTYATLSSNVTYRNAKTSISKTTGTIEQRFDNLKNIALKNDLKARIDEFSEKLEMEFEATQKCVAAQIFHYKPKTNSAQKVMESKWDRKQKRWIQNV